MVSDLTGDLTADRPVDFTADLPAPCQDSIAGLEARVADILRPVGALARLDELAVWVGGWQRTTTPRVERPAAVIFAGDHGVAEDGVSAYPADVTAAMLQAFNRSRASISAMAATVGATVLAVDVGVGAPTANITAEPAMDSHRFQRCFDIGRRTVDDLVARSAPDLLIVGEMGIGNTTAAAAVCGALLGRPGADMVGGGTGVDGETLALKVRAVDRAMQRAADGGATAVRPLEVLRQLGGTELAAMAGAMYQARRRSLPLLLDGYVTSASALTIHRIDPTLTAHVRAGHRSGEPGHGFVLEALGLDPLLTLGLRLGEASGAMAALPLVKLACALVTEVATFTEWFGDAPEVPGAPGGE